MYSIPYFFLDLESIIYYYSVKDYLSLLFIFLAIIGLFLVTAWYLKQKGRSLCYMLMPLIPVPLAGYILLLFLDNKNMVEITVPYTEKTSDIDNVSNLDYSRQVQKITDEYHHQPPWSKKADSIMNWAKAHLNWTMLLTWLILDAIAIILWLVVYLLVFLFNSNILLDYLFYFFPYLFFGLLIIVSVWYFKQKGRSQWHLLLYLIPVVGWIFILTADNENEITKSTLCAVDAPAVPPTPEEDYSEQMQQIMKELRGRGI